MASTKSKDFKVEVDSEVDSNGNVQFNANIQLSLESMMHMTPVPLEGYLKYLYNNFVGGNFENAVYENTDKVGGQVYIDAGSRLSTKFKMVDAISYGMSVVTEEVKNNLSQDDVTKVALQKFIMYLVNSLPKTHTLFQIGAVTNGEGVEYLYVFALNNGIFQWIKTHSSEVDKIYFSSADGSLIPEKGLYVTSEVGLYPEVTPTALKDTVQKEVYHGILGDYMKTKDEWRYTYPDGAVVV